MSLRPVGFGNASVAAAALVLASLAAPLSAQTATIPLNPRATYLHVNVDAALDAAPIALAPLGVLPGMCVRLRTVGDYDQGPNADTVTSMHGIFSASATLLAAAQLHRVAGALEAGIDVVTVNSFMGNQPTDISEDFSINTPSIAEVTVKVPAGATHLFVSSSDSFFQDNTDPDADFAVEITVVGCWTDLGLGLAGATPAPMLVGTGTLFAGEPISLNLTGAKANSSAALIVGFGLANVPFKGGTLVPTPNLIFAGLPTGPSGTLSLPAAWPAGLPSGFSIDFQEWVTDATGPAGFTATNGLQATTP